MIAEAFEFARQPRAPCRIMLTAVRDELLVAERRDRRRLPRARDVDRQADAVQRRNHLGCGIAPADALGGKAVDLRAGARDAHIRLRLGEFARAIVIGVRQILAIYLAYPQTQILT